MVTPDSQSIGNSRKLVRHHLKNELREHERRIRYVVPVAATWVLYAVVSITSFATGRPGRYLWLAWIGLCASAWACSEVYELGASSKRRARWFVPLMTASALLGLPAEPMQSTSAQLASSWPKLHALLAILGFCGAALCLQHSIEEQSIAEDQLRYFKSGVAHRVRLLQLLMSGRPFILYLRDFASESREITLPGPEGSVIARTHPDGDALLRLLGTATPIYGLLSYRQVLRLNIPLVTIDAENWFEKFRLFATHAALIVVHCEENGDGLNQEIAWLEQSKRAGRTLLLAPRHNLARAPLGSFRSVARWVVELEDHKERRRRLKDISVPEDLRQFLSTVASPSRPVSLIVRGASRESLERDQVVYCEVLERALSQMPEDASGTYVVSVVLQSGNDDVRLSVGEPTRARTEPS